ncbi:MAG TPA: prepilin-type N-terminal cleavage/methylation domain-containing protein [Candidatus Polarisedimenticolia bacterium]|jgi:prepilin-type N-terminal cleavage/methylation domain-containing protein|nr:prepilin-type N-terminal cleavage/methylation domain-containing protein [Candidatus Polarisedimenticolia bacterium]
MRSERGMSLAELTVVMVLVAVVTTAVATYSIPWLGREEMRGAVYTIQEYLQLARVQAVSRNRDCRFLIDSVSRQVRAILIRKDPRTGRWSAGDGRSPITTFTAPELPPGTRTVPIPASGARQNPPAG